LRLGISSKAFMTPPVDSTRTSLVLINLPKIYGASTNSQDTCLCRRKGGSGSSSVKQQQDPHLILTRALTPAQSVPLYSQFRVTPNNRDTWQSHHEQPKSTKLRLRLTLRRLCPRHQARAFRSNYHSGRRRCSPYDPAERTDRANRTKSNEINVLTRQVGQFRPNYTR